MKIEKNSYDKAATDASYIGKIATELSFLASLEKQNLLMEGKIRSNYEEGRLRDIKNLISNIYLVLDLHEIKGRVDEIYNPDFKPE